MLAALLQAVALLLFFAAAPTLAAYPDSIRYRTDFNSLALGPLSSSPDPSQDDWYALLRTGGATAEIQSGVASTGRALHLDAPLANPTGLQTIARRNLTAADLATCPVVALSFDFFCATSNLAATNLYNARVSVTGGPHPGYSIIEMSLTSGNGTPKSLGVDVATVAFDPSAQNNVLIPLAVGQDLSWGAWHTVELMLDHAGDRLLQIMVDGQVQDLRAWKPPRTCDAGVCGRGQLTEHLNVEIVPNDVPEETLDRVYVDNLALRTLPPLPPGPCPVSDPIAVSGNRSVTLSWRPAAAAGFERYDIYRATAPFTSVAGMTPVATLASRADTIWADGGLTNGVSYHYAVTAVVTGAPGCESLSSIGPRRPRDETDLQVVTISRQPRYPRFDPTYGAIAVTEPSGFGPYNLLRATGLGGGQTPSTQRWPNPGDPVSYQASVRNRGTNPWADAIRGQWLVDGSSVATPTLSGPLAPGARVTSTYVRPWDGLSHTVEFRLLDPDARAGNNALAIDTKSVAFLAFVDRSHVEDFRDAWTPRYPMAATDDFFDWIHHHMARFNQLFATGGTAKRVHYDVLEEVRDGDPDPEVPLIHFAVFPFRFHARQDDFRTGSAYYSAADDIDYGYLHEMGHQLGLIDIYQMSVAPGLNQVSGRAYVPADELMFNVSPVIGPASATAMTHWLDVAHGYFGQYLYGIPSRVILRFLGNDGMPMADTPVRVYQYCDRPGLGQVITNQVKFSGRTNAQGYWELPNVPIDPSLVPPTHSGDTLRANPWGYVSMLGSNGTLHLELEVQGVRDYAWLDVTEANVAFYSGQRDSAVFERGLTLVRGTPPVTRVAIDIRPGSPDNALHLDSQGLLPVAILGSPGFDVNGVDLKSVRLAGASMERTRDGRLVAIFSDLNRDGVTDLSFKVMVGAMEVGPGDTTAVLTGTTFEGQRFEGQDRIRIVGERGRNPQPPRRVAAAEAGPELAILGVAPRTQAAGLQVRFSLPAAEPASLELFDLAGRRRVRRDVGGLGPGTHAIALGEDPAPPSGVYWVRLTQGRRVRTSRTVLLR